MVEILSSTAGRIALLFLLFLAVAAVAFGVSITIGERREVRRRLADGAAGSMDADGIAAGAGLVNLAWLARHEVEADVRPIVDSPPTAEELVEWIPKSKRPIRKWLNTSGKNYREIGAKKFDHAKDEEILRMLTQDGKLVKRPVLIAGNRVIVGFDEEQYEALFG